MALNCKVLPGRLVLPYYTTLHILASTSLLLNTAVGYQSLSSSLYSKRSLLNKFLANSLAISEPVLLILLYSRNVLSILELWHGAILCLKIYRFCGNTMNSHESVFHSYTNRRHSRVWRKQNENYHHMCIQTTVKSSVSVCKSGEPLATEARLFCEK